MKRLALYALAVAGASSLAACDLAPDYDRPQAATSAAFVEDAGWKSATPLDALPKGAWWELFGDMRLNQLETELGSANQDLKAAVARYAQTRAVLQASRADLLPQVNGSGDMSRQRRSTTVANPVKPKVYGDDLANVDASWEIDLWGRVRNAVAASQDLAQASAADLAGIDLGLHAELAADYFALRGDDSTQVVLDQMVVTYEKALALTVNRYQGGVGAEADVAQAQTQLETARTQAADIRLKRSQLIHAIAILEGQAPAEFSLPAAPLAQTPPPIDPGLPSALLERRPDVAAAERRVAAANASIGVARAAYYPVFNLRAMVGLELATAANWLTAPSSLWGVGPGLAGTLFDGGRHLAQNEQAQASYDETVADYRQTVLIAYRDVEDNLVALHQLEREAKTQEAAVAAADRALTQANRRYTGGLVTYLEVVSAQNALLNAQLSAADIGTRRMTASVLLVKALGGGWTSGEAVTASSQGGAGHHVP